MAACRASPASSSGVVIPGQGHAGAPNSVVSCREPVHDGQARALSGWREGHAGRRQRRRVAGRRPAGARRAPRPRRGRRASRPGQSTATANVRVRTISRATRSGGSIVARWYGREPMELRFSARRALRP